MFIFYPKIRLVNWLEAGLKDQLQGFLLPIIIDVIVLTDKEIQKMSGWLGRPRYTKD